MGFKIVGFAGSLRKGSFNKIVLNAAKELAPDEVDFEIVDLEGIPMFNADLESDMPKKVLEFKSKIKEANAVVIVSPEYNYSVPGVLKNALDWASRPYGNNSFDEKPVGLISSSIGTIAGSRSIYHLRQVMLYLNAHTLNKPEVMIPFVQDKIVDGKLTDEKTLQNIEALLNALVKWADRIKQD